MDCDMNCTGDGHANAVLGLKISTIVVCYNCMHSYSHYPVVSIVYELIIFHMSSVSVKTVSHKASHTVGYLLISQQGTWG
jgi:hypothetical protein